ncbi:ring finger protein-like, partial [Dasypus novemcinctus]|uniref:ring finger protein-like n=1 Tax=Dasypus novemcinctus TaxID=9361 RepID=UPI00265F0128
HPPVAVLEPPPPSPRSCSGTTTPSPTDLSPEHASAPAASVGLGPLDTSCQARAAEGDTAPRDASEPLLGAEALPVGGAGTGEEECPVCTEPYGPGERRLAPLNCGHGLCTGCLHRLLCAAPGADVGRVRCPLCRQKTPMLEWEICRLQEELLQADGPQCPPPPVPPAPPRHGPGPWASLEHRYQLRFLAGPAGGGGCLPFLPCVPCLGARLWALRERGPCARRLALLGLLALELLGLLLGLTPLLLLGLLLALLDRSHH